MTVYTEIKNAVKISSDDGRLSMDSHENGQRIVGMNTENSEVNEG